MGRIVRRVREWLDAKKQVADLKKEVGRLELRIIGYQQEREKFVRTIDTVHKLTARVPTSRPAESY